MISEPTVVLTGRLENWYVDVFGQDVIWGEIHDDIRGRWRDGHYVHTSSIPGLDKLELKEGAVIHTLNSVYLLGKSLADYAFERDELLGTGAE